jgi:hypothetical protein
MPETPGETLWPEADGIPADRFPVFLGHGLENGSHGLETKSHGL